MGSKGIRIEDPGDVREGHAEALAYKDGPVVVDSVVDPLALSLPSHVPFHTAKGCTLSLAKPSLERKDGRSDQDDEAQHRAALSNAARLHSSWHFAKPVA
jgi:hypothetical protein